LLHECACCHLCPLDQPATLTLPEGHRGFNIASNFTCYQFGFLEHNAYFYSVLQVLDLQSWKRQVAHGLAERHPSIVQQRHAHLFSCFRCDCQYRTGDMWGNYFDYMSLFQSVGCGHNVWNDLYCKWYHEAGWETCFGKGCKANEWPEPFL
jgi:hypothetical protein